MHTHYIIYTYTLYHTLYICIHTMSYTHAMYKYTLYYSGSITNLASLLEHLSLGMSLYITIYRGQKGDQQIQQYNISKCYK